MTKIFKREIRLFLILWASSFFALALDVARASHVEVALSPSTAEMQERLHFASSPLVWASARFLIDPQDSFWSAVPILLGNAYFYAILLFPCVRVVQWSAKRNRVTQLGITRTIEHFDTFEVEDADEEEQTRK